MLLGPLTVEPPFRGRGIAKALIARALDEAKKKGEKLVVLVGDEPYYGPLGFKRIPKGRAIMPGPVDPALLVAELPMARSRCQRRIAPDWDYAASFFPSPEGRVAAQTPVGSANERRTCQDMNRRR